MSRKFIWLFSSHSAVNLSFGCIVLKSFNVFWTSEWLVSYIISMSSTYLNYLMILCLSDRCGMWNCSRCCRKNSARRPVVGAPMASPSFWIRISPLLVKYSVAWWHHNILVVPVWSGGLFGAALMCWKWCPGFPSLGCSCRNLQCQVMPGHNGGELGCFLVRFLDLWCCWILCVWS